MMNYLQEKLIFILKKCEILLGLDTVYFFKGSFFAVLQQIFGLTIGLVTSYLFGHFVSREVFGQYNLILSIFALLTFVSLPALDNPLVQSVAKGYEGSFLQTIKMRFLSSLVGIPILIGFVIYYRLNQQFLIANILLIASLLFPFVYSFQSYQAFFIAKQRFDLIALFATFSSFLFAVFAIIAVFFSPFAMPLSLAYLFSTFIPSLIATFLIRKSIRSPKNDSSLIPYGWFLTFNNALPWISAHLGNIILAAFLGVEELAILTVASKYPLTLQKSYTIFSKPLTAKIAGFNKKDRYQTIIRHWWKLLLIGLLMFLVVVIFLPFLLNFLFPVGYQQAPLYAIWIATTLIPLPLSWALNDILIFQKLKKAQILINVFHSSVKLIAYFLVIPIWKTPGMVALLVLEDYLFFLFYLGAFYFYLPKSGKIT